MSLATIVCSGSYHEYRDGADHGYPVMFCATDAGRSMSKRPKQKNDCTVRAVAAVCGMDYDKAYDTLASAGRKCARGFDFKKWATANTINGYKFVWRSFPATKGQSRMNPGKFRKAFPSGAWIARTAKHVFAIINGVVYDTHSPAPDRCIYGAWEVVRES